MLAPHDERRLDISELLPLYLLLQILDRLESIDDSLISMMSQQQDEQPIDVAMRNNPEPLHRMAEKALQELATGETEEGGFAIEER
jgi:hypothetical protein